MRRRWTAVLVAGLAVGGACSSDDEASRDDQGRIEEAGGLPVTDLRVGDCFDGGSDDDAGNRGEVVDRELTEVDAVPCDEAHDREVFALTEHPGGTDDRFPGDDTIEKFAAAACLERFAGYVGEEYGDSDLDIVVIGPLSESWADGDRRIACVLTGGEGGEALTRSRKQG